MTNNMGNKSIGERDWKPHNWNINTNPNVQTHKSRTPGPDWSSRIRCVEPIEEIRPVEEVYQNTGRRHYNWRSENSKEEWSFYWDGSKFGKRFEINGDVKGNLQTTREILVEDTMGNRHKVVDPRGGVPCLASGDKSYSIPEFSKDFHKEGSTLPAINFSRSNYVIADTFIPLQPLPKQKSATYLEKEEDRKLQEEKHEVENLDEWSPAKPIAPGLFH